MIGETIRMPVSGEEAATPDAGFGEERAIASKETAATPNANPENETPTTSTKKPTRKSHKKLWIALAAVTVAVVAAVFGFLAWHEQPRFCNAVCHSPMDPYVENYYSENRALTVVAHRLSAVSCLDCHESELSQQVDEALKWLTGDYSDPLSLRRFGTIEYCFQCHDDDDKGTGVDWDEIVMETASYQGSGRNPHDNHLGSINCYTCHSMHRGSKLYCTQCHDNIRTPETWM